MSIEKAYVSALLADSAYVNDLADGLFGEALIDALSPRMTPSLAKYIGDNFTVVTHIDSDDFSGSGFDATVWKRNSDGKIFVSMCGTEPGFGDFLADGDLTFNGGAREQIADMVNWWLKITTAEGEPAPQIQRWTPPLALGNGEYQYYRFIAPVPATGQLMDAGNIEVSGHSLGGHLATAFARIFGGSTAIDVTTFNSAGFTESSEAVFKNLQDMLGMGVDSFSSPDRQTNYFAANGINVTTNTFWFNQIGHRVDIYNEEGTGFPNHYMYKLTDTLALGDALAKLDPSFEAPKLNALLEAGANQDSASLEGILDALRTIFNGDSLDDTPIGDVSGSAGSRVDFHKNLALLQSQDDGGAGLLFDALSGNVQIYSLAGRDASSLASDAASEFGSLIALKYGLPFVLRDTTGSGASQLYQQNFNDDYIKWRDDALHPEKRALGTVNFSDEWMRDRARLLNAQLLANVQDFDYRNDVNTLFVQGTGKSAVDFIVQGETAADDYVIKTLPAGLPSQERDGKFLIMFGSDGADQGDRALAGGGGNDRIYGGEGDDMIEGGGGDDHIEGNAGDDILRGGAGRDILLGGTGNDTLEGGSGNDILKGGADFDTYTFASGHGSDTIIDSDGAGAIRVGDVVLKGGKETAAGSGVWQSADERFRYMLIPQADGSQTLVINNVQSPDDSIFVKNFKNDMLGIDLQGADADDVPAIAMTIEGDLAPEDKDPTTPGIQTETDGLGNIVTDLASIEEGRADTLFGSGGNDHLLGKGGNDQLDGGDGDDILNGGTGDDLLYGQGGHDILIGGSGSDVLMGGQGNDRLYAGEETDVVTALARQNEEPSGSRGTFLAGGEDGDILVGDTGNDVLFGGAGNDVIVGGAGDDVISGDMDAGFVSLFWQVTPVGLNQDETAYLTDYLGVELFYDGEGGEDVIYAGGGNDMVNGQAGNDFIDGGEGDDMLFGGLGNDVLLGGLGNDGLFGNQGDDYLDGHDGDDYLQGAPGHDILLGGAGKDQLYGHDGDDYLEGGTGDDVLSGGDGDDVYKFNLGDGHDELFDLEGRNIVEFGSGISFTTLTLSASGGKAVIRYGDGDSILINGAVDSYRFADGSVVSAAEMLDRLKDPLSTSGSDGDNVLAGGAGGDVMWGHGGDDVVIAGAGSDRILGGDGADVLHGGSSSDLLFGDAGDDTLYGGEGADMLVGGEGNDALHGSAGNDMVWGQAGDDALYGEDGDDELMPGDGNDVLSGGRGDDVMWSGKGTKTYLLALGDGNDIVHLVDGARHVVFGEGIAPADVKVFLSPAGMAKPYAVVQYSSGDSVAILTGAGTLDYAFADGTLLTHAQLVTLAKQGVAAPRMLFGTVNGENISAGTQASKLYGGSGNDRLHGSSLNDVLKGNADNDQLFGNNGDDLLDGGAGDDTLEGGGGSDTLLGGVGADTLRGGLGSDTYLYARGDGSDLIVEDFNSGTDINVLRLVDLLPSEVRYTREASGSLKIHIDDSDDTIEIQGWYNNAANQLQKIVYADGSVLEAVAFDGLEQEKIVGKGFGDQLSGTAYGDIIIGTAGADVIDGGSGDDVIQGGAGADTYLMRRGMGLDSIYESGAETNCLQLGVGVGFADLVGERRDDDLYVHFNGARDGVMLKDYYAAPQPWTVQDSDGQSKSLDEAMAEAANQPIAVTVAQLRDAWFAKTKTGFIQYKIDYLSSQGLPYQQTAPFVLAVGATDQRIYSFTETTYQSNGTEIERWSDGWGNPDDVSGLSEANLVLPSARFEVQSGVDGSTTIVDYGGLKSEGGVTVYSISAQGTLVGNSELALWPYIFGGGQSPTLLNEASVAVPVWRQATTYNEVLVIEHLVAGAANNTIFFDYWGSVDGGAGDDYIWSGKGSMGGDDGGHFLYGGSGNDFIMNGHVNDMVIGGDGDDYLAGGMGSDVFYLIASETGIKTIDEVAKSWDRPEYYPYGPLANLGGLFSNEDVVEFGHGIDLASLHIRRSEYQSPYDWRSGGYEDRIYETIEFSWGKNQGARVLLADPALDKGQYGIEFFRFSDGTTLSLNEMLGFVEARSYLAIGLWAGDGIRTLVSPTGVSTVRFGPGISADNIQVSRNGDDVVFANMAGDERWTVKGMYSYWQLVAAHFADGTVWNDLAIAGDVDAAVTGTNGDDVLSAPGASSYTFVGGAGDDTLVGGSGDDSYLFSPGDGVDHITDTGGNNTLQFGPGITADMITLDIGSLLLRVGTNGDQIHIEGFDPANALANGAIRTFRFADGTVLSYEQLLSKGFDIHGSAVDDTLGGTSLSDRFYGGPGSDMLLGGSGNDLYLFQPGDGDDRIIDLEGDNTLHIGGGLTEEDLAAARDGDDMIIAIPDTADSITLVGWFSHDEGINHVMFDDGSHLDRAGMQTLVAAMNQPPVAVNDTVTVHEDAGPFDIPVVHLLANDTDADQGDELTLVSVGASGVGASVSLTDGVVRYDIGGSFQELAAGEVLQDSFDYTIVDSNGETATGEIRVDIIGENDAPNVEADTAQVMEDRAAPISGNVLANDSDIDSGTVLRIVAPGTINGVYGSLVLDEDGEYSYNLNNDAAGNQSLGREHTVFDRFAFNVTDGIVNVESSLEVTVTGSNDAPILIAPPSDTAVNFNKAFAWQIPEGSFSDVDEGDVLTYVATLADGSPLPSWLTFDAETKVFSGIAPKKVGYIDIQIVATDKIAASGSVEGSLSVSDIFRVSIEHGNQGVGNGLDIAPPGHRTNFNDEPGTGPGKPGAKGGHGKGKPAKNVPDDQDAVSDTSKKSEQTIAAYLSSSQLAQYVPAVTTDIGNSASSNAFAGWQMVGLAVSEVPAWLGEELGADIQGLSKATIGNLGSSTALGNDPLSLVAGTGKELKTFKGLGNGVATIV